MQNYSLLYTKELQRFEDFINNKEAGNLLTNTLQKQMKLAKQHISLMESIQKRRKQQSVDQTMKLEQLNEKLSLSMEHSQRKKEQLLHALQIKIKKSNQKKRVRKSSEQIIQKEVEPESKEQSPARVEINKMENNQNILKKEVTALETPKMKLAEPKKLYEDEFHDKLNKSMEAAFQRKSQRLNYIKQKLHGQDDIITQHVEKSQKFKEEQEQNRLNQIYNKMQNLTNKESMKKSQKIHKKKKKSIQLDISGSDSQKNQKLLKETEEQQIGQSRTVRSITEDLKYIYAKQRLEQLKQQREERILQILDKHLEYSRKYKQNKVRLDELSNKTQYYNFKIKEQYLQ